MPQILTPGELDHRATGHSCDVISQRYTFGTECSQATLELLLERASCLEQDIQELRHWLLVQPSRIRQTGKRASGPLDHGECIQVADTRSWRLGYQLSGQLSPPLCWT